MPTKPKRKPSYTLHKPIGRARVRIDAKDHYLGEYGSQESKDRYDELIEEWLIENDVSGITLDELSLLYLKHAKSYYYLKDGKQTTEVKNIRLGLRRLIAFTGRTRVREFSRETVPSVPRFNGGNERHPR